MKRFIFLLVNVTDIGPNIIIMIMYMGESAWKRLCVMYLRLYKRVSAADEERKNTTTIIVT